MDMENVASRFWPKVRKTDTCWLWTAATNQQGYGKIGRGGSDKGTIAAHRVSWLLHCGEMPEGMCVLHRCDNPLCVNPDHLFLGTQLENMRDMIRKGRRGDTSNRGERNGRAVLTLANVEQIRIAHASGETVASLARAHGVNWSTVKGIVDGTKWKPS